MLCDGSQNILNFHLLLLLNVCFKVSFLIIIKQIILLYLLNEHQRSPEMEMHFVLVVDSSVKDNFCLHRASIRHGL